MSLENEGSEGSVGAHLEKSHFGNELMTAVLTDKTIMTKMSLSILDDSGWYKVDYSEAYLYEWGKGRGCGFFSS